MRPITIGRWRIELYRRAIFIVRGPKPNCPTCDGTGGYEVPTANHATHGPEIDLCHCWNPGTGIRIPLLPRRTITEPF